VKGKRPERTRTSNGWHLPFTFVFLWLAHSPVEMVAETLNLDPSVIPQFPKNRPDIVPD
jgi:hypothetical protein